MLLSLNVSQLHLSVRNIDFCDEIDIFGRKYSTFSPQSEIPSHFCQFELAAGGGGIISY